mgnify:CR=1 FL=1
MTQKEKLVDLITEFSPDSKSYIETLSDHLLSNGVIVPPCKVGDVIYAIIDCENPFVDEGYVFSISKDKKTVWVSARYESGLCYYHPSTEVCNSVFLTREEAEEALKKEKLS